MSKKKEKTKVAAPVTDAAPQETVAAPVEDTAPKTTASEVRATTPTDHFMDVTHHLKQVFSAGEQIYRRDRLEGEKDLVAEFRNELKRSGVSEDAIETFNQNRFIQQAEGLNSNAQQFELSRYLTAKIVSAERQKSDLDTRGLRLPLTMENDPSHFMTMVRQAVLPNMLTLGLYDSAPKKD